LSLGFLNTRAFWTVSILPLVLGTLLWGIHRRRAILGEFGRIDLLAGFSRISLHRKRACQILLPILCLGLLITVVARPLVFGYSKQLLKGSLDVVAVLDVSKSMAAEDCGPGVSRIDMARQTLLKCLPQLAGNRLGIVTFAGKAFPQAELTQDFQALRFVLNHWIAVDSAPSQGSNIGAALSEPAELFDRGEKKRIILLLSDGGHRRQKNLQAVLTRIASEGVTVVCVGFGTRMGARIPVYDKGDFKEWLKIDGEEIVTRLNESTLQEIARATGGRYLHSGSGKEPTGLFRDPRIVGEKVLSGGREVFQIPLALSIVLLSVAMYLDRRYG